MIIEIEGVGSNYAGNTLDYNKDGSVDIYFGPKAPKRHEKNWIQTVPKKSWFLVIRLFNFCRGEGTPTYMIFVF